MKALITGISGTLGQAVCKILLRDEKNEVVGISRDECKQAALPKHNRLTLYLGDIRDRARFLEASRGVDVIYHFAALKHVDILEANPEESIATNILGTANVLHAQRIHNISRVILSSTDKAALPVNTYGMCKGIAEKLTLRNPRNVVCRYGNVLASRGSAIPNFVKTLKEENTVYITDPNMTRFWITIDDAAQFMAAQYSASKGGLFIPPMKAAPLHLVTETIAHILHINSYQTKYIGMRPGEKINECLRTEYEGEPLHSNHAPQFTSEELGKLLTPIVKGLVA
jgi:UDP-glucose 4-epimerase